jgi:hypothetical protein
MQFDSQPLSPGEPFSPPVNTPASAATQNTPRSSPASAAPNTRRAARSPLPRPPRNGDAAPIVAWSETEICVLIEAKRIERERELHATLKERMKSADRRWEEVAQALSRQGFSRTTAQIKSKWERLIVDFKKKFDYQRNKPSGQPSYFEMDREQHLEFLLPPSFSQEVYNWLECWFPNQRSVNIPRSSLMDSSDDAQEEEGESQGLDSQTYTTEGNETGNDENTPPDVNGASPIYRHGRRKRLKNDHFEESFSSSNKAFVDEMRGESEKRALHDKALLDWEKEKEIVHLQLYKE